MKSAMLSLLFIMGLSMKAQDNPPYSFEVYWNVLPLFEHSLSVGVNWIQSNQQWGAAFGHQRAPAHQPHQYSTYGTLEYRYFFNRDARSSGWWAGPYLKVEQEWSSGNQWVDMDGNLFDFERDVLAIGLMGGYQLARSGPWVFTAWAGAGALAYEEYDTSIEVNDLRLAQLHPNFDMRVGLTAGYRF